MDATVSDLNIRVSEDQVPLLARSQLYAFFSTVFGDPNHQRFDNLNTDEARNRVQLSLQLLDQEQPKIAPSAVDECLHHNIDPNSWLESWDRSTIREEYRQVFGLTIPEDCPPHEVEYCEKTDLFYRSQLMADVGAFYEAFGLTMNEDRPERVDHVRLELEFMQFMLTRQLHGISENHDENHVSTVKNASRDFFEEHIGWWIPSFGKAVESYPDSDFYSTAAKLLRWFITHERLRFGLPVFDQRPEPNVPEREPQGTCFECSVDEKIPASGGV